MVAHSFEFNIGTLLPKLTKIYVQPLQTKASDSHFVVAQKLRLDPCGILYGNVHLETTVFEILPIGPKLVISVSKSLK